MNEGKNVSVEVVKSWRWSGIMTSGWKALALVKDENNPGFSPTRIMISHAQSVTPLRINETLAVKCRANTDEPDWDDEIGSVVGSAHPEEFFPGVDVKVLPGVEELWRGL